MLKYKINVADALERVGFNTYKAKTTGILSQDTLKKLKNESTQISLEALNKLCIILDMDIKDIIKYEESEEEQIKYASQIKNISCKSDRGMLHYRYQKELHAARRGGNKMGNYEYEVKLMEEETRARLLKDAAKYSEDDLDRYISEVGYEPWMDEYIEDEHDESGCKKVNGILEEIFNRAHQKETE